MLTLTPPENSIKQMLQKRNKNYRVNATFLLTVAFFVGILKTRSRDNATEKVGRWKYYDQYFKIKRTYR